LYNPSRFENRDRELSLALLNNYPFATIISQTDDGPLVSHLPLIAEESDTGLVFFGHLARANPHWRMLDGKSVYVIFNGPHTYITPKWYAKNDVPTWNYAVVHAKGLSSLIEDARGIIHCLKQLTQHVKPTSAGGDDPWEFWIPDDLAEPGVLEKSIVGFSIKVESLQAKFKRSQNRSEPDRAGVARGLATRTDDMSKEILALMKQTNNSEDR
jgi:transcriptional regulator